MEHPKAQRGAAMDGPSYIQTLIAVADDCPATAAQIPAQKGEKLSVAAFQYSLLADYPYEFTQPEVLFRTSLRATENPDWEALRAAHWDDFFIEPRACMRTSPLPKQYGWGLHFDAQGRVALHAVESDEYRRLLTTDGLKVIRALRSTRA